MRPLRRPPIRKKMLAEQPPTALLMTAFGPFCMLSERPVPSQAHAWHAGRAAEAVDDRASAKDWDDLFLLDAATFNAVKGIGEPKDLLLPDRSLTFSLKDAPFSYALEKVATTYLDDEGQPEGKPVKEEYAIVRGNTPQAESTIAAFALNSIYFDPKKKELRTPRDEYLSMTDHRLHERTAVWRQAQQALKWLKEGKKIKAPIPLLLDQIRLIVGATGYWSVWATVLWQGTEDRDLVQRALFEPKEEVQERVKLLKAVKKAPPPEFMGAGPHNAFPGTHEGCLE